MSAINCGDIVCMRQNANAWNVEAINYQNGTAEISRFDKTVWDIVTITVLFGDISPNPDAICCNRPGENVSHISGNSGIQAWQCNSCGFYSERMVGIHAVSY
jgi:ribosomal protein L37E